VPQVIIDQPGLGWNFFVTVGSAADAQPPVVHMNM
jgi:hypothetical protein